MRRRELTALLGALPFAAARIGCAQPADRPRRVGYLTAASGSPENLAGVVQIRAVIDGLREFGWVDGRNITVDHRFSGGGRQRIAAAAAQLVASQPDVILTVGGRISAAVLAETRTIPIVFAMVDDPVAAGFAASLAHPGGNATGIAAGDASIAGKWLALLKETAPGVTRVLVLTEADAPPRPALLSAVAAAARPLDVTVATAAIGDIGDYEREAEAFARAQGGGLVVLPDPIVAVNMEAIQAAAARHRLPAIYGNPIHAKTGGLIALGADPASVFRAAAGYIDKILRGANPGDLPVEQPTRFVLAVNRKTADALGLAVPQSILVRADEIIE